MLNSDYMTPCCSSSGLIECSELPEVMRRLREYSQVLLTAPRRSGLSTTLQLAASQPAEQVVCYIHGRALAGFTEADGYREMSARVGEVLPNGLTPTLCENAQSFRRLLLHTLAVLDKPLLLIVDDLELFPEDWRPTWINLLRSIKHERHFQPLWQKLSCLTGSHRPAVLYQLDPASPLNFMYTVSSGSADWRQIRTWMAQRCEGSVLHPTAPLALYGWTQGNRVYCHEVLERLPFSRLISAETIAIAARKYAAQLQLPGLTEDEHAFLDLLADLGTLTYGGSDMERILISRGLVRESTEVLCWANPIVALAWKLQEASPKHSEPGLVLDEIKMEARYQGRLLPFFPQELRILRYLAERPGQFLTAQAICRETSDDPVLSELGAANIKAQIARIRRKLPTGSYIQSRRNVGYCFNPRLPFIMKP